MKQMLTIFLVCQPAVLLLAFGLTFSPAIRLFYWYPQVGLRVFGTIWRGESGASVQYLTDETGKNTAVYIVAR